MKYQVVVYRTGGTERFEWRRSATLKPGTEADEALARVKAQGYEAFLVDAALSLAIGLPETYEANEQIERSE